LQAAPTEISEESHSFSPPRPEELARLFPQLDIIELIGRGGMGAVYKARQKELDRMVALKILPPGIGQDSGFAERFAREAKALAKLNHQGIVTIYDFGRADGLYFFLMEYVDGVNLKQLLDRGRISPREALAIVPQLCDALQFAHDQGIVHRDIKPENILLDRRGRVKVADFGLAKIVASDGPSISQTGATSPEAAALGSALSEGGKILGTLAYMAPEQVKHPEAVDHRADIYALGMVFYQMLTGQLPAKPIEPPSRKVQIDVRLDEVVLRALEKNPETRYQQANKVKSDVETIVATQSNPIAPHPQSSTQKGNTMNTTTNKSLWRGLIIVVASLAVVAGFAAWFLLGSGYDPDRAVELRREGQALHDGKKLGEAQEKFKQAVRLNPRDAVAWCAWGWTCSDSGKKFEAQKKFEQAIRLNPEYVAAWNGLGWACLDSGKSQEAEKDFQKVIAIEPGEFHALNGLGQLYLSQKKYDLAETYLLKAAPQEPQAQFVLARLYLGQEKFDEAVKWASKAVEAGEGGETAEQIVQAAKDKHISDAQRIALGLPSAQ
jgi:Flp pilus assembly protein TadD/predicted Ser/Thr protein kinase